MQLKKKSFGLIFVVFLNLIIFLIIKEVKKNSTNGLNSNTKGTEKRIGEVVDKIQNDLIQTVEKTE